MPDIDQTAEIHIAHGPKSVEVLIPMAGRPTNQWQKLFRKEAKTTQLQVAAHDQPDRFWVQVQVPVDRSTEQVTDTMDDVKKLISKVNDGQPSQSAVNAEIAIRVWWAHQHRTTPAQMCHAASTRRHYQVIAKPLGWLARKARASRSQRPRKADNA